MTSQEIQTEYEQDGGLTGKLAVGQVWRDIAVSCKCGTVDSQLVADEPGDDTRYFDAVKKMRHIWRRCADCGQAYRIGLGRRV
jgi:hypothetical protein